MGKEKPKTDNLAWIKALLFPKKGKPVASSVQPASFETPPPAGQTPPSQPAPRPDSPVTPQTASQPSRLKLSQPATPASAAPSIPDQPPQKPATSTPAAPAAEKPPAATENQPEKPEKKHKFLPAFWTIASILSMVVNVILILILLILGRELFTLKSLVGDQLLGGLYNNFVLMDEAHIKTTILVETEVPVQFTLPVVTNTTVRLTEDTRINGARVTLSTGGLNIVSAPTNIILPAGTDLPIALNITVPVDTTIPIVLEVPVDIPLAETELHEPFVGLQDVVGPYYKMLDDLPDAHEIPLCKSATWLCRIFFRIE